MPSISFKVKIILAIVFFTLFISATERYLLAQNIVSQFKKSKESKNSLLINTISPVISLNLSLGLHESNTEYLEKIIEQNNDIQLVELSDKDLNSLFTFTKTSNNNFRIVDSNINLASKELYDPLTEEEIGTIVILFSNDEFYELQDLNKTTTLKIFALIFVLLILFIFLLHREFKHLTLLSKTVLSYNPKHHNLNLEPSQRKDEIGVIQNAIVSMFHKINNHAKELDAINQSLEEKVQKRTAELEEANKKLQLLSTMDPLTGIANRRHFEQVLSDTWELSKRKQSMLSIIMCDIDHFKVVNDTYGHQVGDVVLVSVAQMIEQSLKRMTDIVARYGGEEFIIVMYDTDNDGAVALVSTIQTHLKSNYFKSMQDKPVTLSFGISSCIVTKDLKSEDIIKQADTALYKAKENGRDAIVSFKDL
ncbi:MAG: diguanylate cyclase [Sulfurimonas sp.]|nr:diguanylate cyclase [Sulfurimonas sp.]MBU3940118.1 diguanylate cyclase [bacterium]MBU4024703.1 diguanylate cyclase [bacterium]MBU4060099.1 diguanylate cyclase [bacterium]MBU4110200.1 diguanylate cyclase [bacterium]